MKKELIHDLFERFQQACYIFDEVECWSARELQTILNYSDWNNFLKVIIKAKNACENSGEPVSDHFLETTKNLELGNGNTIAVEDIALTRYACYLIVQNGDSTKNEISFAQTYFAVQVRKQELIENRLQDVARVHARERLTHSEKTLSGILYERGVDDKSFGFIRSQGDKALFGGFTTQDMKKKLGIPESRPLADFLPTLTIKAKDFATELTSHNVVEKNLKGQNQIVHEHIENNQAIRKMLIERGVKPEELPPAEDLTKVKRRLENEEKNVLKESKKLHKKE